MKLIVVALIPAALSIHVRDHSTKPGLSADFKSLSTSDKKAQLKVFYEDVSKFVTERSSPVCEPQEPITGFTWDMFKGGWYLAYHQPTIWEVGLGAKCSKTDFTKKDGLDNGYEFEMFGQSHTETAPDPITVNLCGLTVDADSAARVKIGTCDQVPDDVNFIVIHHEHDGGTDYCGREFFLSVGTDPEIPVLDAELNAKCMHWQITAEQMGGLFLYTRTKDTLTGDCLQKAKTIVSNKGMLWDGVMQPTPQGDDNNCEYVEPTSSTLGAIEIPEFPENPIFEKPDPEPLQETAEDAAQAVQDAVVDVLNPILNPEDDEGDRR